MSRKKGLSQHFDQLIQTETIALSLDKLLGDAAHTVPLPTLTYDTTLAITTLAQSLGCAALPDATDAFIQKHGSPYYATLDALIEASLTATASTQSPMNAQTHKPSQLFEGLGDLLED